MTSAIGRDEYFEATSMKPYLTKTSARIIEEAYKNGLYVEFQHGERFFNYFSVMPSIFRIRRTWHPYEVVASYEVEELLTSAKGNLIIHTTDGITFEFKVREDKDSEVEE